MSLPQEISLQIYVIATGNPTPGICYCYIVLEILIVVYVIATGNPTPDICHCHWKPCSVQVCTCISLSLEILLGVYIFGTGKPTPGICYCYWKFYSRYMLLLLEILLQAHVIATGNLNPGMYHGKWKSHPRYNSLGILSHIFIHAIRNVFQVSAWDILPFYIRYDFIANLYLAIQVWKIGKSFLRYDARGFTKSTEPIPSCLSCRHMQDMWSLLNKISSWYCKGENEFMLLHLGTLKRHYISANNMP